MKVPAVGLLTYMVASGWGWALAGAVGALVSFVVLSPFIIGGVVVLEGQREKHRHESGTWVRPPDRRPLSQPVRSINQ